MSWLRRAAPLAAAASLLAALALLAQPSPTPARANVACDALGGAGDAIGGAGNAIGGGIEAITGGLAGAGNPVGDICDQVTGKAIGTITSPVTDALKGVGNGIFDQITTWVSEGTTWLIERVVSELDATTTPDLSAKGFLAEYEQMSQIAAVLAAAMLLLAILEAIAQGSWALLANAVLVKLPLAFLATSVGFALVQLLLLATDSMSHAIAASTHEHSQHFFKSAIASLSHAGTGAGASANPGDTASQVANGAAGAVAAPLFVVFLVAAIGAFAAFAVWVEMLMRDASIYVVVLFLPFSWAAWIWPRWAAVLRRTGELLVAVIGSKFVIVAVVALAAGMAAESDGGIEPLLAASALMLLAAFAPFLLLKLVPFAEGAMNAAYGRRSAAGGAVSGLQIASDVQILRSMARSNWSASPPEVWNVDGGSGGSAPHGGGAGKPPGGSPTGGHPGAGGGAGEAKGAAGQAGKVPVAGAGQAAGASRAAAPAGAAAASPLTAAAAAPAAAGKAAQSGARHLEQSGVAKAAGKGGGGGAPAATSPGASPAAGSSGSDASTAPASAATSPGEALPRPPQDLKTKSEPKGSK